MFLYTKSFISDSVRIPMKCVNPELIKINTLNSFFKADLKDNYSPRAERYDYWEAVFVTGGSIGVSTEGKSYILKQGQAIIHSPNEFHNIWSESGENPSVIVISFQSDAFPRPGARVLTLTQSEMNEIERLYELSFECFDRKNINLIPQKTDVSMVLQSFWLRLELLLFSIVTENTQKEQKKTLKGEELYRDVIKFMEENPDGGYRIDDIAEEFSISSVYLKKLFSKYSDCPVMEYYNSLKCRLACTYLTEGRSVRETAELLGFGDQNYFSTFFKRITGKSPTEYKKGGC